jgi:hypothetical protein
MPGIWDYYDILQLENSKGTHILQNLKISKFFLNYALNF